MKPKKEYRYLIIIQYYQDDKVYTSTNKVPINDLKLAKQIAMEKFPVNITNTGKILLKGFKYIYAEVPIETIVMGTKYEMQCIACESLTEEELKL